MNLLRGIDIYQVIKGAKPEKLTLPIPPRTDHADHVVKTALMGYPELAADHLLHKEMVGKLKDVISAILRQSNLEFINARIREGDDLEVKKKKIITRYRCYRLLLEIFFNLIGIESKWVGFSDDEVDFSLNCIINTLEAWENQEKEEYNEPKVAWATIKIILDDMKRIRKGESMLAYIAREVEDSLNKDRLMYSFVTSMKDKLQNNIYYKLSLMKACKFGNDYALGLRWLRHLGFVQVSTNPVLAAIAYDEKPELWDSFKEVVLEHPEWLKDPEKYADEIAMEATRIGLMENFLVFRVPFILSNYHDGLVSYQLNPNIASNVERSLEDALKFYMRTQEYLKIYDSYLLWGYSEVQEKGRPNIVFKVAGAYPAALEIAEKLNERGMGTNITVVYTVSQEVLLGVSEMKGMAKALKRGIKITQVYITNMGGRLEDHLREVEAEKLLRDALSKVENSEEFLEELASDLGVLEDFRKLKDFDEKIKFLCKKKVLRKLTNPAFVKAITKSGILGKDEKKVYDELARRERIIGFAGIYVTQRVYKILFSPENRPKWINYLQEKFGLTREQAEEILDKIDVLPASKRKTIDTILTLASRNMTHTEFPDQQLRVLLESRKKDFKLIDYLESVMEEYDGEILNELMKREDFVKAYEVSPELAKILNEVGIKGDFGNRGLRVSEWPNYGPCVKTMTQFTEGYERFKLKCVEFVKKIAKEVSTIS